MCVAVAAALAAGASGFGATATGAAALGGLTLGGALSIDSMLMGGLSMAANLSAQSAQSKAANSRAQYEIAVAKNNKLTADQNAADAIKRGDIAAKQHSLLVKQAASTAVTSAAGRGVAVGQDSALKTVEDIRAAGALDELTIKNNAEREALGYRQQGQNFEMSGELAALRAWQPDTTFSSILAGGSALADKYLTAREKNMFAKSTPKDYTLGTRDYW